VALSQAVAFIAEQAPDGVMLCELLRQGAAHAVGVFKTTHAVSGNKTFLFFDPNYGLYKCDSIPEFYSRTGYLGDDFDRAEVENTQRQPYVEYLPETVTSRIRSVTQHYRLDSDSETASTFWTNHYEHCGAQIEEEELHSDLGRPFGPMPDQGLEAVRLYAVCEPFAAWAGCESHDVKRLDS
jgi:hypothetical protein